MCVCVRHRMALPLLCDCVRMDGYLEHRDMNGTYVLWVLQSDASHVVFLHRKWLDGMLYNGETRFIELLLSKSMDECCRMISRTLLAALKFKPDYLVIVSEDGTGVPFVSAVGGLMDNLRMVDPDLRSIRSVVEGPFGESNLLGRRLTELCGVLADRGFFSDPKNRRYGLRIKEDEAAPLVV